MPMDQTPTDIGDDDTDNEYYYRVSGCECDNPFGCNCRYGGTWPSTARKSGQ